jgi:hypothetical protein
MIGIAFDVNDLRYRIFCLVTKRMNDHTATYRTVRTSAARFGSPSNLEALGLRINRRKTEPKDTNTSAPNQSCLDEGPSRNFHDEIAPSAKRSIL